MARGEIGIATEPAHSVHSRLISASNKPALCCVCVVAESYFECLVLMYVNFTLANEISLGL